MPNDQWHFARDGKSTGPIPFAKLQELCAQGQIKPTDLIWQQGTPQWQPAGQLATLFPVNPNAGPANAPPPAPIASYAYAPPPSGPDIGENAGIRMLIPVGRSGWAIAAGYLGLFSVLVLPAPIALFCAIMAIREMRQDKRKHGMGRAIFGLIMGFLGTVLLCFAAFSVASRH